MLVDADQRCSCGQMIAARLISLASEPAKAMTSTQQSGLSVRTLGVVTVGAAILTGTVTTAVAQAPEVPITDSQAEASAFGWCARFQAEPIRPWHCRLRS